MVQKTNAILNDPTHPARHYFDSRSGRFLLLSKNTKGYKALFLPSALSVFNENHTSNWVCTCIKTSVEDDNFLREGWGCVNLMIFIWEFLHFGLTEKALFQVILGLLLVSADWEKGGCMSKSVYACVMEWSGRRIGHRQQSQSKMETTAGRGGNQVLLYSSNFQHTQNPHSHA